MQTLTLCADIEVWHDSDPAGTCTILEQQEVECAFEDGVFISPFHYYDRESDRHYHDGELNPGLEMFDDIRGEEFDATYAPPEEYMGEGWHYCRCSTAEMA